MNHLYNSSGESNIKPSLWAPSLHWVIRVVNSSPSKRPGTWRKKEKSSTLQRNITFIAKRLFDRTHLSVGQQRVHPLQEAGVHHVRLVEDEADLLVFATWGECYENRKMSFINMKNKIFKNHFVNVLSPERLRTCRRSSSKSSAKYLLWTLIWNTEKTKLSKSLITKISQVLRYVPILTFNMKNIKLAWKTESPFIQATNLESVVFPEPEIPISKRWPWGCRKIRSILRTWSRTSLKRTRGTSSSSS